MISVERRTAPEKKDLPPLANGDHLDQKTFHERYEATPPNPELIRELIDMEYSQGKTVFTVTSLKKDGTAKGTLGSSSTTAWGGRLAGNVLTFTADFGKIKRDFTVIFAKDGEEWKMKMRITLRAGQ